MNQKTILITLVFMIIFIFGCYKGPSIGTSQGMSGKVLIIPGACLSDPNNPGMCINKPSPGKWPIDIRLYSEPDSGYSNPVIKTFESDQDGLFKVEMPVGKYSLWVDNNFHKDVTVEKGKWVENITLSVLTP